MNILTQPLRRTRQEETVVVKLWEIYLLYHPSNLYRTLTELSLDHGPADDDKTTGRIIFRFSRHDWEAEIKELLEANRIPVVHVGNQPGASFSAYRTPHLMRTE